MSGGIEFHSQTKRGQKTETEDKEEVKNWTDFIEEIFIRLTQGDVTRYRAVERENVALRLALHYVRQQLEERKSRSEEREAFYRIIAAAMGVEIHESGENGAAAAYNDFGDVAASWSMTANLKKVSAAEIERRKAENKDWCQAHDAWRFKCGCE